MLLYFVHKMPYNVTAKYLYVLWYSGMFLTDKPPTQKDRGLKKIPHLYLWLCGGV